MLEFGSDFVWNLFELSSARSFSPYSSSNALFLSHRASKRWATSSTPLGDEADVSKWCGQA